MSLRQRRRKAMFMVSDRVRPSLEILEPDPRGAGFVVAAIIYGDNKEAVQTRADLAALWLSAEASHKAIRRRLRWASIYAWAVTKHNNTVGRSGRGVNLYTLLALLVGCFIEPDVIGKWLSENWGRVKVGVQ